MENNWLDLDVDYPLMETVYYMHIVFFFSISVDKKSNFENLIFPNFSNICLRILTFSLLYFSINQK